MNSQYLHDLTRSCPQLGAAQDMLNAGQWDDFDHSHIRFDLPRLRKLYDFQFHWEQMSFAIEQRFEQTIGLIRALEAVSDDAAVRAIAAKARRDYRLLIELFQEFAGRGEPDDGDKHQ
jgi:hypothetical protein